jgi:drug/metabolite transporter (DMT)-like permease
MSASSAAAIAWIAIGEVMPPATWMGMASAAAGVALSGRQSAPS